jgi:hypothetical protein
MDAQEHVEIPRSTNRESEPSKKFPYFRALMCSIINSETSRFHEVVDQQGCRDSIVQDHVCNIVPRSEGEPVPDGSSRSTFLTKRDFLCL